MTVFKCVRDKCWQLEKSKFSDMVTAKCVFWEVESRKKKMAATVEISCAQWEILSEFIPTENFSACFFLKTTVLYFHQGFL